MKNYVDLPVFYRNPDVEGSGGGDEEDGNKANGGNANNGDGNGAQGDEPDITKLIEKAVADAVAGLKRKNEEVIGTNKKLKAELDAAKTKPSLSEEEYSEFMTLKERIERDELLKALTEGKSEEVIEKVTRKVKLDYEAKLAAEAETRTKREAEATEWRSKYEQTLISNEITKSAAGAIKPQYHDLITKLVSERVRLVDGSVRVVNSDGEIEMTANGAKPLTVADYIETLRTNYSDLFVVSSGGGAGGSKGGRGTSTKMSTEAASSLSMEDYIRLRSEGKI